MGSRTGRWSMSWSSPPFVTAAPSRPSADSRASRSGISTSRQPLCAPTRRSSRSSIGSGNRSRAAKSRFAWQRSIRRRGRPTPIVGWRLVVREDGWSSNSNLGRQAGELERARERPVRRCWSSRSDDRNGREVRATNWRGTSSSGIAGSAVGGAEMGRHELFPPLSTERLVGVVSEPTSMKCPIAVSGRSLPENADGRLRL